MSSYPTNARSGRGVECGGRWSNRMWASYIKRGSEGKWAGAALPHRSLLDPLAATSIHGEPSPVQGILSWQPRTRHPRQRVITDCHGVALKTFMSAVSLPRYMANCCHGNLKILSFWVWSCGIVVTVLLSGGLELTSFNPFCVRAQAVRSGRCPPPREPICCPKQ